MTNPTTPSPSLPRANVLSYITSAYTPTHLRNLSSRLLKIIGGIHLLIATLTIALLLSLISIAIVVHGSTPGAFDLLHHLSEVAQRQVWIAWFILLIYAATCGITLWVCAALVRDGRAVACHFATFALIPTIFILLPLSAVSAFPAIIFGFGLDETKAHPICLLFFILTAFLALLILLVGDLIGYLTWIAKNPITEKPPVPFL